MKFPIIIIEEKNDRKNLKENGCYRKWERRANQLITQRPEKKKSNKQNTFKNLKANFSKEN